MSGGYDEAYAVCTCVWGREPGKTVKLLDSFIGEYRDRRVLDIGCGDGRNAAHLDAQGARVTAIDISDQAINNAKSNWPGRSIDFRVGDVRDAELGEEQYDVVLAYGLLHCLASADEVLDIIRKMQRATRVGGYNVLACYNSRSQDLAKAHPEIRPTLLNHHDYVKAYEGWGMPHSSDSDLFESHPHNNVPHVHSMTRILARKGPNITTAEYAKTAFRQAL